LNGYYPLKNEKAYSKERMEAFVMILSIMEAFSFYYHKDIDLNTQIPIIRIKHIKYAEEDAMQFNIERR
jgi:hypothetical protein